MRKERRYTTTWMLRVLLCAALLVPFHFSLFTLHSSLFICPVGAQTITIGGNVYGGGNRGNLGGTTNVTINSGTFGMTISDGDTTILSGGNVFGGARMADVNINEVTPPAGQYAANITFNGGAIRRDRAIYGGNDITGDVHGGAKVDIRHTVDGSVYGGGNGSYAYTDNANLATAAAASANEADKIYADVYYNPIEILSLAPATEFTSLQSAQALNLFRPNVEKCFVTISGSAPTTEIVAGVEVTTDHNTYIAGKVFCGGNSATLAGASATSTLQIGSYVVADQVFMGSNGEDMIKYEDANSPLQKFANSTFTLPGGGSSYDYSQMNLLDSTTMAEYMKGVEVSIRPTLNLVGLEGAEAESSKIGSFFLGGNVGSMTAPGTFDFNFNKPIIIYTKLVGGCNAANVPVSTYNAAHQGGLTNDTSLTDGNKVYLQIKGFKFEPSILTRSAGAYSLAMNSNQISDGSVGTRRTTITDPERMLVGGNVYGGCYESGYINGNVKIDITQESITEKAKEFLVGDPTDPADFNKGYYNMTQNPTWTALSCFGGGYGDSTEIRGNTEINVTTGDGDINLYKQVAVKVFGGGEMGRVTGNTTVNVKNGMIGRAYGGSFRGAIGTVGNSATGITTLNLEGGLSLNAFGGSCDADIEGYSQVFIGTTASANVPWVRENIYGGNDFGGTIKGSHDFMDRVLSATLPSTYGWNETTSPMFTASSYVEYQRGKVENPNEDEDNPLEGGSIFGGSFGYYDYSVLTPKNKKPRLANGSFVNFRPTSNSSENDVTRVFGGSMGYPNDPDKNKMQSRSYVLVDVPSNLNRYADVEVFGAGDYAGLGMASTPEEALDALDGHSAVIDLVNGKIAAAYGGSYTQGITRRTVVNVPAASTIQIQNIFGGAYGTEVLPPCDVYESNVNYNNTSENATVSGAIYGGNNSERRTLYAHVNVSSPVWSNKERGYLSTVYGAGQGFNTWAEYTEVNLNAGARVYEVYGGGEVGHVLNAETMQYYMQTGKDILASQLGISASDDEWLATWSLGNYYIPTSDLDTYANNAYTNLTNTAQVTEAEIDDRDYTGYADADKNRNYKRYNTNVLIHQGATVVNYAYGGGLGVDGVDMSGDVFGSTYIALLGGTVTKDIYAGGTSGAVYDRFLGQSVGHYTSSKTIGFTASANAYIKGGTVRNVYGGGWNGDVGYHGGLISATYAGDRPGETHVHIGDIAGTTLANGVPAITRTVYGGGEGGSVFGNSNVIVNNGYIGYVYEASNYKENLDDEPTPQSDGKGAIDQNGNVFGGGYVANSYVDNTHIQMFGGTVRGSLYGGGEVGPVGRGTMKDRAVNNPNIFKAGSTKVELYNGHVLRNVFGGGRGFDSWGGDATKYMDAEVKKTLDLSFKGYVFGQTKVNIYGGEVGTDAGMARGFGNVFGGGDIGFVYSAYDAPGNTVGLGKKSGTRYDGVDEGHYYKYESDSFVEVSSQKVMTEDCKVVVEPWAKAKEAVNIGGFAFNAGEYVPTEKLNYLQNKNSDATWGKINDAGIIIHNAVFAGGNTSSGSDHVYANTNTVYGNATASIHDVYHRDLITIGTGHTGGLYGDGNLTLVDGYRELNITNYGTDYYNIDKEITLARYKELPAREQAYYELRYKCLKYCTDDEGKHYYEEDGGGTNASTISADDLFTLFANQDEMFIIDGEGKKVPNPDYWQENGVCSRYAGRIMNTIQRADFCGVFGSRMVMQGAPDRVPEVVDYTNYTINRVGELSLNKKNSDITGDSEPMHGNYFGIYSVVNHLGALTSDVDFYNSTRTTEHVDGNNPTSQYYANGTTKFSEWKATHIKDKTRNNGSSHNQVALASGVYLELTTELSSGNGLNEKEWGYITGVVELDLINVQPGIGGGFVYAKNVHGVRSETGKNQVTLTALNSGAEAKAKWQYTHHIDSEGTQQEWESSGNFVHSTQTIIDDCYDISYRYKGSSAVPAHYWYIKGQVYVYDQFISAYTGSSTAYSEKVNIPLTITAASHGSMKLIDVKENKYAYYKSAGVELGENEELNINEVLFKKNQPISYWDWSLMTPTQRTMFKDKTYVNSQSYKVSAESSDIIAANSQVVLEVPLGELYSLSEKAMVPASQIYRSSNNLGHNTGYILTYEVNNPKEWNTWYTAINSSTQEKINKDAYAALASAAQSNYNNGPTYRLSGVSGGVFGQKEFKRGDVISKTDYDIYQSIPEATREGLSDSAHFVKAYIVTGDVAAHNNTTGTDQHLHPGAVIDREDYSDAHLTAVTSHSAEAFICTSTIQLSPTEFIYINSTMSLAEKDAYLARPELALPDDSAPNYTAIKALRDRITNYIVPAYYCASERGKYCGKFYEANKNYRGLEAWSSLSEADRSHFEFNYDALDLLIDENYSGNTPLYDKSDADLYSGIKPVDYTATFNETSRDLPVTVTVKHSDGETGSVNRIVDGDEIGREDYERLLNEKHYYASFTTSENDATVYIVHTAFVQGNTPYAVGQTISSEVFNSLTTDEKTKVTTLTVANEGTYYYCREGYTSETGTYGRTVNLATGITGAEGSGAYAPGSNVPKGLVINATDYTGLTNLQANFTIHGIAPVETSTLYVSRESDIYDLSTEKIITVIYQYDYEESDETGSHITPVSERHVVNIHINFKSGVPTVPDIEIPRTILPGNSISIATPVPTPGAYEITGGGWELFEEPSDAEAHTNGVPFAPNINPLYWYQDGFYLAYYATTYLGKTYSNAVPVSVANYHDIYDVMADNEHHMYIDVEKMHRDPKIYIDNKVRVPEQAKTELDMFYDLYDLSSGGSLDGHSALGSKVSDLAALDFILSSDVTTNKSSWTPVGNKDGMCFAGWFHGNGFTVSGLDNSLFGSVCGNIYNVGVMGSFTEGGIAQSADAGSHIENTWVSTTAVPVGKPIVADVSGTTPYVYNSYYPKEQNWTGHDDNDKLDIIERPLTDFVNGEVAYRLNSNYLQARYLIFGGASSGEELSTDKHYYYCRPDGTFVTDRIDNKDVNHPYPIRYTANPASWNWHSGNGFVEDYMGDGDFRYSDGVIPLAADVSDNGEGEFIPVFPDDYIYFGQTLSYDLYNPATERPAHDLHPMGIVKDHTTGSGDAVDNSRHLLLTLDTKNDNRLYRAPAYFRSGTYGKDVIFNAAAAFADSLTVPAGQMSAVAVKVPVHKGLTAVDFTGDSDITDYTGVVPGKDTDFKDSGNGYAPMLDYFGLQRFKTRGITKNLLIYTPANSLTFDSEDSEDSYANTLLRSRAAATNSLLTTVLSEPLFSDYHKEEDSYKRADVVGEATLNSMTGHHVQLNGGYKALSDHLLVDRNDFNAPISYTFDTGKRMWYQRQPDNYADRNKGWEAVSLPFSAELVTTQNKGEITHFYTGSTKGHEYWLREYTGIDPEHSTAQVKTATFNYPAAAASGEKTDGNTFLWDYYYSKDNSQDANSDQYLEGTTPKTDEDESYKKYYTESRTFENYPYVQAGKPYIVGFPSETYYEFDLSGNFDPHTMSSAADALIEQLAAQTITFASDPAITIAKSDTEQTGVTADDYAYKPSYLNDTLAAATGYALNGTGSSFDVTTAETVVPAFRPYFIKTAGSSGAKEQTRSIVFGSASMNQPIEDDDLGDLNGRLDVKPGRGLITVTSSLRKAVNVSIVSAAGVVMDQFRLQPGESHTTHLPSGIYIVAGKKYSIK